MSEMIHWKQAPARKIDETITVGDLVRHIHRPGPGEVRAVVDTYAVVRWPHWDKPELCPLSDVWRETP
jgi:hypothetical protein